MVDPLTITSVVLKSAELTRKALLAWARSDEVRTLYGLLAAELFPDLEFSPGLFQDESFLRALHTSLEDGGRFQHAALIEAVEPHVGPAETLPSARLVAKHIVETIEALLPRAKRDTRSALHFEFERIRADIAATSTSPSWHESGPLLASWVPRRLIEENARLAGGEPGVAAGLARELADDRRRRRALSALSKSPPDWMSPASAAAWLLVARFAEAYGDLHAAQRALVRASERPHARPAALLARAASAAHLRGASKQYERLMTRATRLDASEPAIAIAQALAMPDAGERQRTLEAIEGLDDEERSRVLCLQAHAAFEQHNFAAALSLARQAGELQPESLQPRELEAMASLRQHVADAEQGTYRADALAATARSFCELADDLDAFRRSADAALLRTRAALCHVFADDLSAGRDTLNGVTIEGVAWPAGEACEVAETMIAVGMTAEALTVLSSAKHTRDAGVRLLTVLARLALAADDERPRLAADLDELLTASASNIRSRAALERQIVAIESQLQVPLSSPAREILNEVDAPLSAIIESFAMADDPAGAEVLLLRHSQDPRVLHRLSDLALARDDTERALELIQSARERCSEPQVVFRLATLLTRADQSTLALAELRGIYADQGMPRTTRAEAVRRALSNAVERRQWEKAIELAETWLEIEPNRVAQWEKVEALGRLGRYAAAFEMMEGRQLDADTPERAQVAAVVLLRAPLARHERVERLAQLSERFGRAIEQVELSFATTCVGVDPALLEPPVAERAATALADFASRFPDSAMRAVDAPSTPEQLRQFGEAHLAPAAQRGAELLEQVEACKAPLTVVAASTGIQVSELWGKLNCPLPLGTGDPQVEMLERADAVDAFGGAAVLDASSLVVAGGLGPAIREAVRAALPAACLPMSVLQDADRASFDPFPAAEPRRRLSWDPIRAEPVVIEESREETLRDRHRAEGVHRFAQSFRVEPDFDPEAPSAFDGFLTNLHSPREGTLATWPATLALATRLQLTVYSDDRVIRLHARQLGLAAFGTLALLEALHDRGLLSADQVRVARGCLWRSGASGVFPTLEEVGDFSRPDWGLSTEVLAALADPVLWRNGFHRSIRLWLGVLELVASEAQDELWRWVARTGSRIPANGPGALRHPELLIPLARQIGCDPTFVAALRAAFRNARARQLL